ncbi:MAG TPA: AI-2E family transporter [Steroidobacteraceae bacterium]|nr:AI-2E family transporter [Steroidobacteraceae bacterium]
MQRQTERIPALVGVAVLATTVIFLYAVRRILLPFVLAGIVAYLCTPLIDWLAARMRGPRWLFAGAVLLLLIGLAAVAGFLWIPALVQETAAVFGDLQGTLASLLRSFIGNHSVELLGQTFDAGQIATASVDGLRGWFVRSGGVLSLAAWGLAGSGGFILLWVVLGYLLFDARRVATGIAWLVPPRQRPFAKCVWESLDPVLRRYFLGVALVVTYATAAAYVGLGLVLGLHHAVLLALLTGLLEVIPVIGPGASAVTAGLVAVHHAVSAADIIAYVLYAIALRLSIDQFVGPIVLGSAARVHPVLVIFCFLSGGVLFGIVGVILAVPIALSIKAVLAIAYADTQTQA